MSLLATPARRRLLFFALYFSEGAPIGFIWWYLPTRLRIDGVPVDRITALTAMLVLPWALKFLWAPLVDTLRGRRWSLRSWIASMQILMGLTLLPIGAFDPVARMDLLGGLLLAHALAAATQDVAIDALAISSCPAAERGSINGWMQAGMLLGRALFGGAALVVAQALGPQAVRWSLVGSVWATMVLLAFARPVGGAAAHEERTFLSTLRGALSRRETWLGLGFAAVSGAAFEAVGAVAGPYLVDRGFDGAAVGTFLAVPAVAAMLVGALAGGVLSDRLGRRRSAAAFLILIAAVVIGLAAAHSAPHAFTLALLTALYLGIGLFTASSYALFMDLTEVRLGATQFSAYMAATNVCESWSGFGVGRLTAAFGYATAFATMAVASLIGLPILRMLRRR